MTAVHVEAAYVHESVMQSIKDVVQQATMQGQWCKQMIEDNKKALTKNSVRGTG